MAGNGKGGKFKTIIIAVLGVILAVGVSVAGTLWFLGETSFGGGSGNSQEQSEAHTPASYFELADPLVVSVSGDQQRYLQLHLAFVMRGEDVSAALERHRPTVRSRLRGLLQEQSFEQLRTREGKQALLEDMRDAVNAVLKAENASSIEQVLFTNFVMQ
ncbi:MULTISPECIES: flagellar basal body-associated FliL family protein [Halomonadaceae]|uniref:Flagellar protein FliL n=1 Tax=Vreelandella halophila TaxID=86177 RepID=A0A9X4YC82_9GAMM|nr:MULTISPECIES: flagellar basal body-associated FliL family protein [Halomonas]MYL27039.1 flagellar basal body protein FliL [Halomonas utahensis]MYL75841.1 flagellar basal body protein FliL [Halomonas sp. 22501_18_FS]